ncbi:shikimate dehydrogenase family protein [Flavobacterium sp.]|uniref:shikimate dehydrogenase family protein n=1 Tax=Flavobacterium sp. TaxID=239 RepID=UPI003D1304D6
MKKLGLVGRNIGYSFSKNYFASKFKRENITDTYEYENYDLPSKEEITTILKETTNLIGLNVTIPYKEEIIPFLDGLSEDAKQIGAVNTLKKTESGQWIGYNTDYYGFLNSLFPLLQPHHTKALILGTGGASKAVCYALAQLNISTQLVSRNASPTTISYTALNQEIINSHTIIVNCSPLGTFPDIEVSPEIPYQYLSPNHIAYDLIYNPEKTAFLTKAQQQGATIKNGYEMLILQAEKAWEIWNDNA